MTANPFVQSLMEHPDYLVPIRVDQYQHMLETGILPEGAPIELIDGVLVRKDRRDGEGGIMTVGKRHRIVVTRLATLLTMLCQSHDCYSASQQPVIISDTDVLEPDVTVIQGHLGDESLEHPDASMVLLVVEVAHSSLSFDRKTKLLKYAAAGVPRTWIVNLVDNTIENYEDSIIETSRYRSQTVMSSGDVCPLTLPDGTVVEIAVDEILS